MKRILSMFLAVALLLTCTSALADGPRFVTIGEWLEAEGNCGDCILVFRIREVLGPVLAVAQDDTGTVNIYTGGETSLLFDFSDQGDPEYYRNAVFVISNPEYNVFEGTVEMKNWQLERVLLPFTD